MGRSSDFLTSAANTENKVAACATRRHFRPSTQTRLRYQSSSLGSSVLGVAASVPRRRSALAVHRRIMLRVPYSTTGYAGSVGRGPLEDSAARARLQLRSSQEYRTAVRTRWRYRRLDGRIMGPQPD